MELYNLSSNYTHIHSRKLCITRKHKKRYNNNTTRSNNNNNNNNNNAPFQSPAYFSSWFSRIREQDNEFYSICVY